MYVIKRSKEVLVADFPQSKVILNLVTYIPYILNHTASLIWDFLKKPKDKNEVVVFLQKRYKISMTQARKDVHKFVRELKKRGFVEEIVRCKTQNVKLKNTYG